jgi:hypothetical protein
MRTGIVPPQGMHHAAAAAVPATGAALGMPSDDVLRVNGDRRGITWLPSFMKKFR